MLGDWTRWIWTWILVLVAGPIALFALANLFMLIVLAMMLGDALR